jgi:hypothetical protein
MMQVDVENAFNNIFQATIFRELCDVEELLASIISLPSYFMVFVFLFITSMGSMWRWSPLLNHF